MPAQRDYRRGVETLRSRLAALAERLVAAEWDDRDIPGALERVMDQLAPIVAAGRDEAAAFSDVYLSDLLEEAGLEPPTVESVDADEERIRDAMGAWVPMTLAAIAAGGTVADARSKAEYLASRFADAEVTAAADEAVEGTARRAGAPLRWEGIVDPRACDPCQANRGLHDLEDEFYRHPDCGCERVFVLAET